MKFSSTLCFNESSNLLLHNSKSISSQTSYLCTCTVHGHKYSSPSILSYIFHIKPYFSKKNCEVISKRILIIFAPEEAEIFKDYLFILARFSIRIPLFSFDLKTIFLFSDFAIFVFKSPENKNHTDKITIR